jgi:hypothetical protein
MFFWVNSQGLVEKDPSDKFPPAPKAIAHLVLALAGPLQGPLGRIANRMARSENCFMHQKDKSW